MYVSPKLLFKPEINSKYFGTGECVGIGQTTVVQSNLTYDAHDIRQKLNRKCKASINGIQ